MIPAFLIGSFICLSSLSLFASEPEPVYGMELDWNDAKPSKYTNIFINGFYTTEIEIKLNSYANRGAGYLVPYNSNLEETPKVEAVSDVTSTTCMVVDGRMYTLSETVKVSQRGTHKIRICNTVVVNGEYFANLKASPLEEFYFYVDVSSNQIESVKKNTFYYSEYSDNSPSSLIEDVVSNFNGFFDNQNLKNSTIYNKSISTIEASVFNNGHETKMSLYNAISTRWDSFIRDGAVYHQSDISDYAKNLRIYFSITDTFGHLREDFKILSVEDDEAQGNISFSAKQNAAIVIDVQNGTNTPLNNTQFLYYADSSTTVADLLSDWTSDSSHVNKYKYNILDCLNYSHSGNRWLVNEAGEKINENYYKNFVFSFSGDSVLNRNLATSSNCEYVGSLTVLCYQNKNYKFSSSLQQLSVNLPVFFVKRRSLSNTTAVFSPSENRSFKQGVDTSYNSANLEIFNLLYSEAEKYSEIPFSYVGGNSFRDYSSFPDFISTSFSGSSLKATHPGTYNVKLSTSTFYDKPVLKEFSVNIKDENLPIIISKYEVTYIPTSKKGELLGNLEAYFKMRDDVGIDPEQSHYTFSVENWFNSDVKEVSISFHAVDLSGNSQDKTFVIIFYNSNETSWWEKNINPGLYAYKKWFLGLFGLNP